MGASDLHAKDIQLQASSSMFSSIKCLPSCVRKCVLFFLQPTMTEMQPMEVGKMSFLGLMIIGMVVAAAAIADPPIPKEKIGTEGAYEECSAGCANKCNGDGNIHPTCILDCIRKCPPTSHYNTNAENDFSHI